MPENQLLALELGEALNICMKAGIEADVSYTCPPKGKPSGRERVVRFKMITGQKGELVVAREVLEKEV